MENQRLQAVVSMPSGVFKPYAGVSTAIFIFTKTGHGATDQVWFYDMTADGFSLDDKRTPVADNDIPDIIERFRNLEKEAERKRTENPGANQCNGPCGRTAKRETVFWKSSASGRKRGAGSKA